MIYLVLIFVLFTQTCADKPCAVRPITNQSVVCVCNSTYCDDVIRDPPVHGTFVIYTSSQSGLRFKKSVGRWSDSQASSQRNLLVDPSKRYQRIEGFGGAVTDSAAMNWKSLPPVLRDYLIKSYFGDNGLEYNMVRTPIGGSDFSTRPYAYNELPRDDKRLTNFTFSPEDILYKIPMFKSIFKVAKTPVHIVASTWSPPPWMKTNQNYTGIGQLKPECYQSYADYHLKFIEMYNAAGVPIWGITTTNEPINGLLGLAKFNSLGWNMIELGKWIEQNLGPTIRNSTFKNVKIIIGDDQRLLIPYWFNALLSHHPKALEYVDGVGVHYYVDKFISPMIFDLVTLSHPDKFILATEACEGSYPWQTHKVVFGSWDRAKSYIIDILQDLNYNLVGWIDWNMCLNTKGGPNWASNFVDSPIIVDVDREEFVKQPMFYAMGHFSKFIPRDSVRIAISEKHPFLSSSLHKIAFVTPRNTIVVIIFNDGSAKTITLRIGKYDATLLLEAQSISTVEFPHTFVPFNGKWIEQNLGPTLRNSRFRSVKIIAIDDQRTTIPSWFNVLSSHYPKALAYIDGFGVHYYTDKSVPPAILDTVTYLRPDKFILATEACEGISPMEKEKIILGSWNKAKAYIIDILQDLNYHVVGWIDWNMCLDIRGGPSWVDNFVDSPIIVDAEREEFVKQPMFYAMGHFSKFVPRGSVRIKIVEKPSFLSSNLHKIAFITPKRTIVVIIYNDGRAQTINLQIGKHHGTLLLEAHSISTVEFPHTYWYFLPFFYRFTLADVY